MNAFFIKRLEKVFLIILYAVHLPFRYQFFEDFKRQPKEQPRCTGGGGYNTKDLKGAWCYTSQARKKGLLQKSQNLSVWFTKVISAK